MTTTADDARADVYMSRYAREQGVSEDTARVMYALNEADCLDREEVVWVCKALRTETPGGRLHWFCTLGHNAVNMSTVWSVAEALLREGGLAPDYDRMMREIAEAWG